MKTKINERFAFNCIELKLMVGSETMVWKIIKIRDDVNVKHIRKTTKSFLSFSMIFKVLMIDFLFGI